MVLTKVRVRVCVASENPERRVCWYSGGVLSHHRAEVLSAGGRLGASTSMKQERRDPEQGCTGFFDSER